ncbi:hypothetical protein Dimus_017791 [Dionaea muscipula]
MKSGSKVSYHLIQHRKKAPPSPLTIKASRSKSSFAGEAAMKESEGLSMEGTGSVGFNRKRAEGRDCSDRPKTLHKKMFALKQCISFKIQDLLDLHFLVSTKIQTRI